ncbi:MAG: hypothetical protein AAFW75_29135, partial [Cyanobacteria bacterium J06636_16]
ELLPYSVSEATVSIAVLAMSLVEYVNWGIFVLVSIGRLLPWRSSLHLGEAAKVCGSRYIRCGVNFR